MNRHIKRDWLQKIGIGVGDRNRTNGVRSQFEVVFPFNIITTIERAAIDCSNLREGERERKHKPDDDDWSVER